MFTFDTVQCCLTILLLLAAGEIVSARMKAAIPAILTAGILYTAGLWAGVLPAGLTETAGFATFTPVATMLIILGMGASTSVAQLRENWRVVALSAAVFALQVGALYLIIGSIFGVNTFVGGLPGGTATALIVQERARSFGYDSLIVLSVLLLSVQGLVGCPLVALCLRKEARRLLAQTPQAASAEPAETEWASASAPASPYRSFLRLLLAAWVAARIELLTGLSRYVVCLLLGVALGELGFLRRDEVERTNSKGFLMLLMMSMVLSGFSAATPQMFLQMLAPLAGILLCGMTSILAFAPLLGRLLGFSPAMSIGIGMNIMIGFPMNLLITEDVVALLVKDKAQGRILVDRISTKMIIGGFTSTTFLAVLAAGLLVGLMR